MNTVLSVVAGENMKGRVHHVALSVPVRITCFLEKPAEGLTSSRLASVVFYCLQKDTLPYLSEFLSCNLDISDRTMGKFWVGINEPLQPCVF